MPWCFHSSRLPTAFFHTYNRGKKNKTHAKVDSKRYSIMLPTKDPYIYIPILLRSHQTHACGTPLIIIPSFHTT